MEFSKEFSSILEQRLPKIKSWYIDSFRGIQEYASCVELGPHILYGDVLTAYIKFLFADEQKNKEEIERVFLFIEELSVIQEVSIGEVIRDSVLEGIWEVIKDAYKYAGPATRKNIQKVRNYFQPIDLPRD